MLKNKVSLQVTKSKVKLLFFKVQVTNSKLKNKIFFFVLLIRKQKKTEF